MAKELPYFKFEPNQWENGNIQMNTFEEQGVFIGLCSMYWARLGDLPYKLAVKKLCGGNANALDTLYEDKIIDIIDGVIFIDFLNIQLAEFENKSQQNSKIAREGWEKRRKEANAKQTQSERKAIREEKIKEEKIKEEKIKEEKIKEKGKQKRFTPPAPKEIFNYFFEKLNNEETSKAEAEKFFNHYEANGWLVGKNKMKDWKAASNGWVSRMKDYGASTTGKNNIPTEPSIQWINTFGKDIQLYQAACKVWRENGFENVQPQGSTKRIWRRKSK